MEKRFLSFDNATGGLADSSVLGPRNSFAEGVGVDIHSKPGIVTVKQRLKKDSGTTITELCRYAVKASDGNSYWFSSSSGKVWRRTSAGTWSLLFTNANGFCVGAGEFDDYVYYASSGKLGRYGPLSGTPSNTDSWATLSDCIYHPMVVQGVYLVIGNARTFATVSDAEVFTSAGTPDITFASLPRVQRIRTLSKFGGDVLAGTFTTDDHTRAMLIRWDTVAPTFLADPPDIPETLIQAVISKGFFAYVMAGEFGQVYYYDGLNCTPFKKIQGTYTKTGYSKINPAAVGDFEGYSMFGVSQGGGNPALEGIYSLGHKDKNYPVALTLDYLISTKKSSDIEIGCLLMIGKDIFASWKDGSSYGVDVIDWDNKFDEAYFKTLVILGNRSKSKVFKNYVVSYKAKPSGTDFNLAAYKNYGDAGTALTLSDKTASNKMIKYKEIVAGALQLKVAFTVSANSAPEMDSLFVEWVEESIL